MEGIKSQSGEHISCEWLTCVTEELKKHPNKIQVRQTDRVKLMSSDIFLLKLVLFRDSHHEFIPNTIARVNNVNSL